MLPSSGSSRHHTPVVGARAPPGWRERCVYHGGMETPSTRGGRCAGCCVVLMMKSPARSKRRLAEHIGAPRATEIARRLLECACEDLMAWPGRKCVAPSAADECADAPQADAVVVQRGGNLGERIQHVNEELI